jgi:transposase
MMVVILCLSGKVSKDVANDLGISVDLVNRWKREYTQYRDNSFVGNDKAVMKDAEKEIAQNPF